MKKKVIVISILSIIAIILIAGVFMILFLNKPNNNYVRLFTENVINPDRIVFR